MKFFKNLYQKIAPPSVWARPEMAITFRAEIMPGKNSEERTFRVSEVLRNGRVTLYEFAGEHRESEFEAVKFKRQNP